MLIPKLNTKPCNTVHRIMRRGFPCAITKNMTIDIIGSAAEVTDERVEGCAAAVIDVFRATSVMIAALGNGAREIIPMEGVAECFDLRSALREEHPGLRVLLGGERNTELIEGFDLDNSPLRYTREAVEGATLIMSTTNGTRALRAAMPAERVFVAALANARAAADTIAGTGLDAVLVCSGRSDRFTLEDGLCAGAIARRLRDAHGYRPTDFAWVMIETCERWANDLPGALEHCEHYRRIRDRWAADVAWCLQTDITADVPQLNDQGRITL